jgi:hypothetical protein
VWRQQVPETSPNLLNLTMLGPFFDYYVHRSDGLHFGLALGLAILSADNSSLDENPLGIAGTLAGGYDWWIGTQWSVGLLVRLTYAGLIFENEAIDERHNVLVPALTTTFTHH